MEKSSSTALTHQQPTLARNASGGHSSHTVYGGHEHVPRHTGPPIEALTGQAARTAKTARQPSTHRR